MRLGHPYWGLCQGLGFAGDYVRMIWSSTHTLLAACRFYFFDKDYLDTFNYVEFLRFFFLLFQGFKAILLHILGV